MKTEGHQNGFGASLDKDLNHYEILLVEADASAFEIQKSYERLKNLWEDDWGSGDSQNGALLELIEEAHRVLSNPHLRRRYDADLIRSEGGTEATREKTEQTSLPLWKTKAVRLTLGVMMLATASFSMIGIRTEEDPQKELAALQQLYPPAPRRAIPSEKESHLALLNLGNTPTAVRKTQPVRPSLLHEETQQGGSGESGADVAGHDVKSGSLLRDLPLVGESSHKPSRLSEEPAPRSTPVLGGAGEKTASRRPRPVGENPLRGTPAESGSPVRAAEPESVLPKREVLEKEHPVLLHNTPQTSSELAEPLPDAEREVPNQPADVQGPAAAGQAAGMDMNARIHTFVRHVLVAFENKDWEALNRCFDAQAMEDGSPWSRSRHLYRAKFEKAETIKHEMTVKHWKRERNGLITVAGDYRIRYVNKDGSRENFRGTFTWSLKEVNQDFLLVSVKRKVGKSDQIGYVSPS